MSHSLQGHIQEHGFESTLDALIDCAYTQARLHQALGDRVQWEYWVKTWLNLRKAADRTAFACDDQWLEVWNRHLGSYLGTAIDFSRPDP